MNRDFILVTESDLARLRSYLESAVQGRDRRHLEMLQDELDNAEVVPSEEIPANVITMNSRVRVRDLDSSKDEIYTLVFPKEADISRNRISILAPLGVALLGYRKGDIIEWPVPGGTRRLCVEDILYQPEADGDGGSGTATAQESPAAGK